MFPSCQDCLPYLASAETNCDLLLPVETAVHDKWLPVESGILLAAECWQEECNQVDSLGRKPFFADRSLSRKQAIADSLR